MFTYQWFQLGYVLTMWYWPTVLHQHLGRSSMIFTRLRALASVPMPSVLSNCCNASTLSSLWRRWSLPPKDDSWTPKSGPEMWCFVFQHVYFESVWNVLRATKACTSSTSQLPKVLGTQVFYFFSDNVSSKSASRNNGACNSWPLWHDQMVPCPPLFRRPEPQNIEKNIVLRRFLLFRALCSSFFWLFLLFDLLLLLLFSFMSLPTSAALGSLTSKLPFVITIIWVTGE